MSWEPPKNLEFPPDVEEKLEAAAEQEGILLQEFRMRFFFAFLKASFVLPDHQARAAKLGMNEEWAAREMAIEYVRKYSDLTDIIRVLKPDLTPRSLRLVAPELFSGLPVHRPKTGRERAVSLRAWAERQRQDTPLLSDEAISREAIYDMSRD